MQGFNVSLVEHHLSETCGENADAAENGYIFQFMRVFKSSLTPEVDAQHTKRLQSRPASAVCV
jgi:hypothetical protein